MSMNILKASKGSKIRFTGKGGWEGEAEHALSILQKGEVYTIDQIGIYQAQTYVFFEGYKESFNSVMFEDVFETKGGVEYGKIRDLTNAEFTHFVMDEIENVTRFRELERVVISIDDFGCDPNQSEEIDPPTIVIDVKVRGALWTFWFDTDEEKFDFDIMNDRQVERYLAMKEGREPRLPGLYSYRPKEESI
ncbi:hypothetical protein ACTHPF_27040 [Paenibacillus sp. SAF-054]|uniref:hypothetical protein n=1 Tax=unclassified Paenibacillus TaxID=185978 RepID=UPI003F81E7A6